MYYVELLPLNLVPDKMKIDGYVLYSTMENWILAQVGGVNVVMVNNWYIIKRDTKLLKMIGQLICFNNCINNGMILGLSLTSGDYSLFLR